jgi:cell division protein ZapA (FtsZ GTPase activity inhibitor)
MYIRNLIDQLEKLEAEGHTEVSAAIYTYEDLQESARHTDDRFFQTISKDEALAKEVWATCMADYFENSLYRDTWYETMMETAEWAKEELFEIEEVVQEYKKALARELHAKNPEADLEDLLTMVALQTLDPNETID